MTCSSNSSSGRGHGRNRSVHNFAGQSFMVRQHRGPRGGNRSDQSGSSIFSMDSFFDRNIAFGRIWRLFIYGKSGDP